MRTVAVSMALIADWRVAAGWMVASAVGLFVASRIDPYLLVLAFYVAAGISGLLILCAALFARRNLLWALASATPAAIALHVLSGYRWA